MKMKLLFGRNSDSEQEYKEVEYDSNHPDISAQILGNWWHSVVVSSPWLMVAGASVSDGGNSYIVQEVYGPLFEENRVYEAEKHTTKNHGKSNVLILKRTQIGDTYTYDFRFNADGQEYHLPEAELLNFLTQ